MARGHALNNQVGRFDHDLLMTLVKGINHEKNEYIVSVLDVECLCAFYWRQEESGNQNCSSGYRVRRRTTKSMYT